MKESPFIGQGQRLSKPRNFSCYPVLIHVNGVTDAVKNSNFFSEIIDSTSFFQDDRDWAP